MPTNNPKVSGYVPQHIYDRFKSFCDERSLSMSQAVVLILSEHLDLDARVDQSSLPSSLLSEKLAELEQRIVYLSSSQSEPVSEILSKVEFLTDKISILERRLIEVEKLSISRPLVQSETNPKYEQLSFTETRLPNDETETPQVVEAEHCDSQLVDDLTAQTDLSEVEQVQESVILLDDLEHFLPLHSKVLSARLSCGHSTIGIYTKSKNSDEFAKWAASRDLSNIRWKSADGVKKYIPDGELSSGQKSELLKWLQGYAFENPKIDKMVSSTNKQDVQDVEVATKLSTQKPLRLSGRALAKRLKVSSSEVSKYKKHYPSSLSEWTRNHDPENLAWQYSADLDKYIPVIPAES